MKEGADAINLIGRPVSATAVEDRVKHGRIHLCIMKELPRAMLNNFQYIQIFIITIQYTNSSIYYINWRQYQKNCNFISKFSCGSSQHCDNDILFGKIAANNNNRRIPLNKINPNLERISGDERHLLLLLHPVEQIIAHFSLYISSFYALLLF